MEIGIEISLYPLHDEYREPIRQFIDRLNTHAGLRIVTNSMSTQLFGPMEQLWPMLGKEMGRTFTECDKAVCVMKVLGPLAAT